jgi:hypothetical protein
VFTYALVQRSSRIQNLKDRERVLIDYEDLHPDIEEKRTLPTYDLIDMPPEYFIKKVNESFMAIYEKTLKEEKDNKSRVAQRFNLNNSVHLGRWIAKGGPVAI